MRGVRWCPEPGQHTKTAGNGSGSAHRDSPPQWNKMNPPDTSCYSSPPYAGTHPTIFTAHSAACQGDTIWFYLCFHTVYLRLSFELFLWTLDSISQWIAGAYAFQACGQLGRHLRETTTFFSLHARPHRLDCAVCE